ncbi:MAG: hypothetical protein AB7S38_11720 [Vulcanimicrobiota bacterium]
MSDFQQHLQALAAEGRLDSSGKFSLNLAAARSKIASHQFSEPNFYLLKLVQAAVAMGAYFIDIRPGSKEVEVLFGGGPETSLVSLGELGAQLLTPLGGQPGVARHLALGILAGPGLNRQLEVIGPEGGFRLKVTPDAAPTEELTSYPAWCSRPGEKWCRLTYDRRANEQQRRREIELVKFRCRRAPLLLAIDGSARLEGWDAPVAGDWHEQLTAPFYLLEGYLSGQAMTFPKPIGIEQADQHDGLRFRSTRGLLERGFPTFAYRCLPDPTPERWNCSMAYAIASHLSERDALVTFVKDGVSLEPVYANLGIPGLSAYVDGSQVQVDLSEFAVVNDQPGVTRALDDLRQAVAHSLRALRPHVDQMPTYSPALKGTVGMRLASALEGFMDGAATHGGGLLGAAISGLFGFATGGHEDPQFRFRYGVSDRLYWSSKAAH